MLTAIVLNLLVGCAVVAAQTATVNVTITTTVTTGTSTPCGVYGFYPHTDINSGLLNTLVSTFAFSEKYTFDGGCYSTVTFVALVTVIIGSATFYPSPVVVPISIDTTHNGYFTTYNFPDLTLSSIAKLGSMITFYEYWKGTEVLEYPYSLTLPIPEAVLTLTPTSSSSSGSSAVPASSVSSAPSLSSSPPSSTPTPPSSLSGSAIGGIVGGFVGLLLIVCGFVFLRTKRRPLPGGAASPVETNPIHGARLSKSGYSELCGKDNFKL